MIDKNWLRLIFGRNDPPFDWPDEVFQATAPTADTAAKLTLAFENAAEWAHDFPDSALNNAFWHLPYTAFPLLADEKIPWELRRRLIGSFATLFEQLFALRCAANLGHLSQQDTDLNSACYMWWDFDCWHPTPGDEYLDSMERILRIPHVACQESALHGLGHWHHTHPRRVEEIIDAFLKRNPSLPPELATYAKYARQGCVQ